MFPLATRGRHIVDAHGCRFRLKAVNWYGASDVLHVAGGLDVQSLSTICETVRDLGFNAVRLPFSNEMLRRAVPDGAIDFSLNPQLTGLSPIEVYDEVVRGLGRVGVVVVLNNHTTYGEFCGPPGLNSLWFDPGRFTEEQWIEDWAMMARRYSRFPHVVAYDLRNEIRPRGHRWPFWRPGGAAGDACGECNWARAAGSAADRLLEAGTSSLIVVERIVWPQQGVDAYVAALPRLRERLVLGVHMYYWSGPGRFVPRWAVPAVLHCVLRSLGIIARRNYGDLSPLELRAQALQEWGCVLESAACPVWVSEFGANLGDPEEMRWLQDFVEVLKFFDADWAYWPLNVGQKPGTREGDPGSDEIYGMLLPDWTPKAAGDRRLELLGRAGLIPSSAAVAARPERLPPVVELGARTMTPPSPTNGEARELDVDGIGLRERRDLDRVPLVG